MYANLSRLRRYSFTKTRCQAVRARLNQLNRPSSVADQFRTEPPRGASGWPRVAGVLPRAAKPGQRALLHPSTRLHCPALAIFHFLSSSFACVRSTAAEQFTAIIGRSPACSASPSNHRNYSTSSPVTHCFFPCPLIVLGKPPQRV